MDEKKITLVIGKRGSGKSVLTTALICDGASYLNDDIIPVESSMKAPVTMKNGPSNI